MLIHVGSSLMGPTCQPSLARRAACEAFNSGTHRSHPETCRTLASNLTSVGSSMTGPHVGRASPDVPTPASLSAAALPARAARLASGQHSSPSAACGSASM